jgi:hypothetical protein
VRDSNSREHIRSVPSCALNEQSKIGGPVGIRTPILGFVDQDLVQLDDKPKMNRPFGARPESGAFYFRELHSTPKDEDW